MGILSSLLSLKSKVEYIIFSFLLLLSLLFFLFLLLLLLSI